MSRVTNIGSMLEGATLFAQELGAWDTSSVTNMVGAFCDCTAFNSNISAWDTV